MICKHINKVNAVLDFFSVNVILTFLLKSFLNETLSMFLLCFYRIFVCFYRIFVYPCNISLLVFAIGIVYFTSVFALLSSDINLLVIGSFWIVFTVSFIPRSSWIFCHCKFFFWSFVIADLFLTRGC